MRCSRVTGLVGDVGVCRVVRVQAGCWASSFALSVVLAVRGCLLSCGACGAADAADGVGGLVDGKQRGLVGHADSLAYVAH